MNLLESMTTAQKMDTFFAQMEYVQEQMDTLEDSVLSLTHDQYFSIKKQLEERYDQAERLYIMYMARLAKEQG